MDIPTCKRCPTQLRLASKAPSLPGDSSALESWTWKAVTIKRKTAYHWSRLCSITKSPRPNSNGAITYEAISACGVRFKDADV